MAKSKLTTPDWIKEGFDSKEDWEKKHGIKSKNTDGKIFKIKKCPKCGSYKVNVVLSGNDFEEESNTGKMWECRNCKWTGRDTKEEELNEEKFMKYLEKEEV